MGMRAMLDKESDRLGLHWKYFAMCILYWAYGSHGFMYDLIGSWSMGRVGYWQASRVQYSRPRCNYGNK
jgi:hypothetical protein